MTGVSDWSNETETDDNAGRGAADRVIETAGGCWSLYWAWEDPARAGRDELTSSMRATGFLRQARDVRATAATLRRFLRATWVHGSLAAATDAEVVDVASHHLATGFLRAEPWVAPRPDPRSGQAAPPPAAEPKPAAVMDSGKRTKLTWIAIELVGEDDSPIPGEEYEITLPDGSVRRGSLDDDGKARERGIDEGTCKVKFPKLDKDAWEWIESVAE